MHLSALDKSISNSGRDVSTQMSIQSSSLNVFHARPSGSNGKSISQVFPCFGCRIPWPAAFFKRCPSLLWVSRSSVPAPSTLKSEFSFLFGSLNVTQHLGFLYAVIDAMQSSDTFSTGPFLSSSSLLWGNQALEHDADNRWKSTRHTYKNTHSHMQWNKRHLHII